MSTEISTDTVALEGRIAERLVERMTRLFGVAFSKQYGDISNEALLQLWAEELAGFTVDELLRGILACDGRRYPPQVAEFKGMCRPTVNSEALFVEACNGLHARKLERDFVWSHPAVFWAATHIGSSTMLSGNYGQLRGRWDAALALQMSRLDLPLVPPIQRVLVAPGRLRTHPEQAVKHLAGIKELLRTKPQTEPATTPEEP